MRYDCVMDQFPSAPVPKQAWLIVNTHSRRGRKLFRRARRRLRDAGIGIERAIAVRKPADLNLRVADAIAAGAKMVIVGGGDGTISGAVDGFVESDAVFALLPLGTANSFARTLGIPLDLDGAIEVIAHGRRARIDLGAVNGDYFANVAAIGMPSIIGASIPDGLKRVLGRGGYMLWALWCLVKFRPFDVRLNTGRGTELRFRAVELRIANGSYLGGTQVAEDAAVDSGDLLIQVVTGGGRLRLGWNWLATALRLPARRHTVETVRGREVRITTDPPLPISIDGEVTARTPLTASVAKGVLEVVVPAPV